MATQTYVANFRDSTLGWPLQCSAGLGRTRLHSLRKNSALRLCFEGARLLRLCFEGARLQPRRKRRKINGGFSRWGWRLRHKSTLSSWPWA